MERIAFFHQIPAEKLGAAQQRQKEYDRLATAARNQAGAPSQVDHARYASLSKRLGARIMRALKALRAAVTPKKAPAAAREQGRRSRRSLAASFNAALRPRDQGRQARRPRRAIAADFNAALTPRRA